MITRLGASGGADDYVIHSGHPNAGFRDGLLLGARRDIDVQVRLAKRTLTEHAADLAVQLATDRITTGMTAADQARLVDRYPEQVKH